MIVPSDEVSESGDCISLPDFAIFNHQITTSRNHKGERSCWGVL